jgi:hypothetical protein
MPTDQRHPLGAIDAPEPRSARQTINDIGLPRVFRTGFLLVLGYFLAVQPSVVNFLRCAVSEP